MNFIICKMEELDSLNPCTVSKAHHARQPMGGTNIAASFQPSRERKTRDEEFSTRLKQEDRWNSQVGKCIAPRFGTHLSKQAKAWLSLQERDTPPFKKHRKKRALFQTTRIHWRKRIQRVLKCQFIYSAREEVLNGWHHKDSQSKFV